MRLLMTLNAFLFSLLMLRCESLVWRSSSSSSSVSSLLRSTKCNRNLVLFSTIPNNSNNMIRRAATPLPPINEYIKADRVRLIGPGNESSDEVMIGIMPLAEALKFAQNLELDLVMINEKGDPPVCKAIDYGKFKYSQEKKKKENMKKQVKSEIKEVKMSYKIDQHDFDVRMRAVQKFLGDGDRVKVVVQFKGREMQHQNLGRDLLMKIYQPIADTASMESTPKVEGRAMAMIVAPKKTQ